MFLQCTLRYFFHEIYGTYKQSFKVFQEKELLKIFVVLSDNTSEKFIFSATEVC